MLSNLHNKFLKFGAIFGLVPYMMPSGQRQQQQQHNIKQTFKHLHRHHQHHHLSQHHYHLQHYKRKNNYNNYEYNNRFLRWQQIYTVTLIAANLITTLYSVIFLPFEDNIFVSSLVSLIVFVTQIVTVISILLETMFSYTKYYELLNNYDRVEILMKHLLQIQLCPANIKKRQRQKYLPFALALYGSLITSALIISIKTYYGFFWYALIAIVVLRTRCLQLSFYLDYIVYYLELFNIKLNALISCKIHNDYRVLDIDYEHLESFDYLQNLKGIYMEIYFLHEKYNQLFGHSLAVTCTVVVLDIIINLYWTFLTLFAYYESHYIYITFSTLVPLLVILFTLCYTAEQCENQCNLVLISLQRLLRTFPNNGSTDTEGYNSLLQSFILQIVQNPITINANGYFTINLKSLMKILTNTATYLVILLQFRTSSVKEEQTKTSENNANYSSS